MVKSMTGYGRCCETLNGREISVDVKSVNHRFFEPSVRVPRSFAYLEERIRAELAGRLTRGKLELNVNIVNREAQQEHITLNSGLAQAYYDVVNSVSAQLGVSGDVSALGIVRLPDVISVEKADVDEDALWNDVSDALEKALGGFLHMRSVEGAKLAEDVENCLKNIEACVDEIERGSTERVKKYTERLNAKMAEVLAATDIDAARILQEAALYADRTAVDEETVRLRSHISQMRDFIKSNEPVGRKMDFLIQEFNREANTIGSRSNDIAVTRTVVELKSQIEKIREQIQNIE